MRIIGLSTQQMDQVEAELRKLHMDCLANTTLSKTKSLPDVERNFLPRKFFLNILVDRCFSVNLEVLSSS